MRVPRRENCGVEPSHLTDEISASDSDDDIFSATLPKAKKKPAKGGFSLDDLIKESEAEDARQEKIDNNPALEDFKPDLDFLNKTTAQLKVLEKAKQEEEDMLADDTITVSGALTIFRPDSAPKAGAQAAPGGPCLSFSGPCPRPELSTLYSALRGAGAAPKGKSKVADAAAAAADQLEVDLAELVSLAVIPRWLKAKGLAAPPPVCLWLLRIVALHRGNVMVVENAARTLEALLEEEAAGTVPPEWGVSYSHIQDIWRGYGAAFVQPRNGSDKGGRGSSQARGAYEDDEDADGEHESIGRGLVHKNMGPFLRVLSKCLELGRHNLSGDELHSLVLDLCAAHLDSAVQVSCSAEVSEAAGAALGAVPQDLWEEGSGGAGAGAGEPGGGGGGGEVGAAGTGSFLAALAGDVASLEEARPLGTPLGCNEWVLVAQGLPQTDRGGYLLREACHRILTERVLCSTSYAGEKGVPVTIGPLVPRTGSACILTQGVPVKVDHASAALQVVLNKEGGMLQSNESAYERQLAVVTLTGMMVDGCIGVEAVAAAAATAATAGGEREAGRRLSRGSASSAKTGEALRRLLEQQHFLNGKLKDVVQPTVQQTKTLLDQSRSMITPFLPEGAVQTKLQGFTAATPGPDADGSESSS